MQKIKNTNTKVKTSKVSKPKMVLTKKSPRIGGYNPYKLG